MKARMGMETKLHTHILRPADKQEASHSSCFPLKWTCP